MTDARTLIHVQLVPFPDGGELGHGLRAAGWDVPDPESPAQAAARRAWPDAPAVGLLDLRGVPDAAARELIAQPQLAAALVLPGLQWVAVLRPGQLECEGVRRLVHAYCHDYVTLPCDALTLSIVMDHAMVMARLPLGASMETDCTPLPGMVGESEAMRRLAVRVRKAARSEAPVFLSGETGTGKELAAAAIHRQSRRRGMPFVAINCGAIPHSLMQSELFGYERGAFTGAVQRKLGRVEQAHGGTLFLDEVADLPMESQSSLLRFLEEGRIERLGGREPIRVDARIVSATHVELHKAVEDGRFRADLYHRLRVIELRMPALRERGNDIALIAHHALHRHAGDVPLRPKGFKACALRAMQAYPWPGNVRELINRVREAMVMAEGCYISARDLRLEAGEEHDGAGVTIELARREGERAAIERALARNGQRVGPAADELGISRVTLYRLMLRHGLHEARPEARWSRLAVVKGGREEA